MYAKYGRNDKFEGVYDNISEAIQSYYKVTKNDSKYQNKFRSIISSCYKTAKTGRAGWYKIKINEENK
ncbi:hypothetical protein SCORR_v1c04580 [Spiroplasma corruscae]|uniref:Uncharacterized protein n=1 Tax=Spiroplasma corruscae TaxID=216934 RepID=A0A222EP16_9MOLU|nr:hypothetical protein [Spiroplasma corruscae]ASP28230.1 hypothetical protein SCORR_v1c04580 [Spiroplasma corruscae]